MRDSHIFETIIILTDELSDTRYESAVYHFKNMITNMPATRVKTEVLGKKRLAYEIKNRKEGYYLLFTYQSSPDKIADLERHLREDDNVIKFITVNTDDKEYDPDPEAREQNSQPDVKQPVDVFDLIFGI